MKTESERHFEQFCERNGFALSAIPPVATERTPDYTLSVGGQLVVVEVKEIDPTPEELESTRVCRETDVRLAIRTTPGKKVRQKITDSRVQIKARTGGTRPGLLVLWESGWSFGFHTRPYDIRVAMAGFEQVIINLPHIASGESPSYAGMKHGGGRKLTEGNNRSLSAVALLSIPGPDQMRLDLYHNRYAENPLAPSLLASAEVTHSVMEDDARGVTMWRTL
jgi:hypothetical protein